MSTKPDLAVEYWRERERGYLRIADRLNRDAAMFEVNGDAEAAGEARALAEEARDLAHMCGEEGDDLAHTAFDS